MADEEERIKAGEAGCRQEEGISCFVLMTVAISHG